MNKQIHSELKNKLPPLPTDEMSRLFYHSMMQELSVLREEIGDYTAKDIIYRSLGKLPGVHLEWGNPQHYGRNRILLSYLDKAAVLDTTPIIQAIKLVWNTYIQSQK
jgi:hypothetical protein